MKFPFPSKYPNFFLVCIPIDMPWKTLFQPCLAQGYCEGVGRFSGRQISRLKKPVMTKRASLGASSVSDVNATSVGRFPTPTSPEPPSRAPYQRFPQCRESQERRRSLFSRRAPSSLSPSRTLESRGSGPFHRISLHKIVIA